MTQHSFSKSNDKATPASNHRRNQATVNDEPQVNANERTIELSNTPFPPNLSTQKQDGQKFNQLQSRKREVDLTTNGSKQTASHQDPRTRQQGRWAWNLKAKATVWAIAVSMLPVLAVGTTYHIGSQSITEQIAQARLAGATDIEDEALHNRSLLLLGTGVTAVLAGAIAAFLANRALSPVLSAAAASTTIVNKLGRKEAGTAVAAGDELVALETNISLIEKQLPDLLWNQAAEAERLQVLMNITRRILESLSEENVFKITVDEVRKFFRTERVVIFQFSSNGEGTFVAESVAPSWSKTLGAKIYAPYFKEGYVEQYRNGGVSAIDNIYEGSLTDSHIELLERFSAKANLSAPIIKDNQLFGLLIAHQCSGPRFWQQAEIDLFAQLATQVGFALDYARLLEQVDTRADQAQVFINISHRIRESLNEEDVLRITVEEVRKAIGTDRVIVYSFDSNWYGTVIAESVVPGFPKALRAKIKDPCFEEGYVEKYQAGRVQATNNIYEAGLTACYINQLEPFAVKANLVAPILKDNHLFGLLIAHECSGPRDWQQAEIDLFAQLATQVGFALDHARLVKRIDAEGELTHLLADVTRRIRESLNEEDVLRTTVEEVRKAIGTDRVIVYSFDSNWYGTVIAESVVPGFPKALRAKIKDPCFEEGYVEKYQAGRVQAINNIYEAGLTACYINQLEPFAVKANLVAPILKDGHLFGLLIAHECSGPRDWQQFEINLFAQLATQVGFALDHARLLDQVEQAYQSTEAAFEKQSQQKEALQRQVSGMVRDSKTFVDTFSTEALGQMETVKATYNQIQALANSARGMFASAQQAELQDQQICRKLQEVNQDTNRTLDCICAIQKTVAEAVEQIKYLDQPSRKLSQLVNHINKVTSEMKLVAMNGALEVGRTGEAGQKFAFVAEKVLFLVGQLDGYVTQINPLVAEIQTDKAVAAMESGKKQALAGTELVEETQQKLNSVATLSAQLHILLEEIASSAASLAQTSTSTSKSFLNIVSITNQTSEQSLAMAESLAKLAAVVSEEQVSR